MNLLRGISIDWKPTIAVMSVVIALRLASFAFLSVLAAHNPSALPYPVTAGDSIHYATLADNMLRFGAYQWTYGVPYRGAPPGYSALLAATEAATGSMTPLVALQILLAALAAAILYRMSRALLPASWAWLPPIAYAADPMSIFADSTIVTDGLFSSVMIAIVYLAFFQSRLRGSKKWALVGLLLGASILLRPIGQYLIIVFPALYLLDEWMRGGLAFRPCAKAIAVFLIACALVIVPWMARNEAAFGSFEISNLGSDDLLRNDARGFLAWRALAKTPSPLPAILVMRHSNDPVFSEIDKKIDADLAALTPPGGDPQNYEGALALSYILGDPIRYGYFHAVNTIPFFISSSIASYEQTEAQLQSNEQFYAPASLSLLSSLKAIVRPTSFENMRSAFMSAAPVILELLWWVLVAAAAIAGAALARRRFIVIVCAVLVLYFAALTGPMSTSRYRVPAEPYLLLLAAVGAYAVTHRQKPRKKIS